MSRDPLDMPLLQLAPGDHFTVRDAVQGVLATGGIGSGKTTGSAATIRGSFLRIGMGGLVLCAKHEEAASWRQACAKHGRSGSLIELDGSGPILNFLSYELARQGSDGINSVIESVSRVLEICRNVGAEAGRPGDEFWTQTSKQILRNSIPALYAATGTVRIPEAGPP